jgi:thiamine biosynthesis lipoprotein
MGTRVSLAVRSPDRRQALRQRGGMLDQLEATEAELSTWREDSLLAAVNRQPVGESAPYPATLCTLIGELGEWRRATGGAFDPGVGRLVDAWGLRGEGRRPSLEQWARARSETGLVHVRLEVSPCRLTRTRDVRLDAGAFGKGAALDRVRDRSGPEAAPWLVDLGGQVAGQAHSRAPWPVALAHPLRRDSVALRLELATGSLATSGGSERDVRLDGAALGHILDPRTGSPVSRAGSVTVWHARALVADVLSTALQVMGPDAGIEWAEARGVAACFLEAEGDRLDAVALRATAAFRERFLPGGAEGGASRSTP